MTLFETLKRGEEYLARRQIPDASLDAWYLLEHLLKQEKGSLINRAWFLLNRQEETGQELLEKYEKLLEKRGSHVPLQHITGEQEFMGISFLVNEKVLVPRQDTEILVEEAMKAAKPGMEVLDLCTGSGCILISLMKRRPGMKGMACDLSGEALQVAEENSRRQGVDIDFRHGDLFEAVTGRFDLIVSNPPYIPTDEISHLMEEVRLFDPVMALDGGEDGLYFYRNIVSDAPGYLKDGGWLMVEIGHDQGEVVAGLLKKAGFGRVEVCKDLAGLDRVVKGRLPEKK